MSRGSTFAALRPANDANTSLFSFSQAPGHPADYRNDWLVFLCAVIPNQRGPERLFRAFERAKAREADGFYESRKTAKPKLPFAIAMKTDARSPLPGWGTTGKIPNPGNRCARARLSQVSL